MDNKTTAGDTVTIPLVEYVQLKEDSNWLSCLEAAGVDNWDGFDEAKEIYKEDFGEQDD